MVSQPIPAEGATSRPPSGAFAAAVIGAADDTDTSRRSGSSNTSEDENGVKIAITAEEEKAAASISEALVSDAFEINEAKSSNYRVGSAKWGLRLNPVVTLASIALIWGFITWAILMPEATNNALAAAKTWVTEVWTWAYIGSQIIWAAFLIWVYFSKYGDLKLGKQDEDPEFSRSTWFFMLFASGLATGFFYYAVAETIWHYEPCYGTTFAGMEGNCTGNRYAMMADNPRAQAALNQTWFHWGILGWVVYALVGLLLGLLCYRQGLPLTTKSMFYPLIGERIYGWIGDAIDTLSVVTNLFGVCTSLALGILTINAGLNLYFPSIPENSTSQIIIIWCITALATVSVVSGVHVGIRRISEFTFACGSFLLICLFFMSNSWFILNLFTQTWGWHIITAIPLSLQTDAFAQLGTSPDGQSYSTFMDDWTIFYWGWWIAWAPFVGMFIAKISKGRTIREFLNGVLTIPIIYVFFWMTVFGGAGLEMEREAAMAGVVCSYTEDAPADAPIDFTFTEDGRKIWRLSCLSAERQYFALWEGYPGYVFFGLMSIGTIALYFVTSSDSGSLVIDCMTSNGNPHPPVPQRVFWAVTEGAAASALLFAGGTDAVKAVQTASLVAGLPYTFILCFMCPAIYDVLRQEGGDFNYNRAVFHCHMIDPISSGASWARTTRLLKNVFAPFLDIGKAGASMTENQGSKIIEFAVPAVTFYGWILLMALQAAFGGALWAMGWTLYVAFFLNLARLRSEARASRGMEGNFITDAISSMVAYPLIAAQLGEEVEVNGPLLAPEVITESRKA